MFSFIPNEEQNVQALQAALSCRNLSPCEMDFCSFQLCPLKYQPVNWMGMGNTFWLQLHNYHSQTNATEDYLCNSLPLFCVLFFLVRYMQMQTDSTSPHGIFWKKCFQEWATMAMQWQKKWHPAHQSHQLKNFYCQCISTWIWLPIATAHLHLSSAATLEAEQDSDQCREGWK